MVGADGLHSQVRALAFGPQERFEKYLGIVVAAFDVKGYRPRDELVAVMHAEVGIPGVAAVAARRRHDVHASRAPRRRRAAGQRTSSRALLRADSPAQVGRPRRSSSHGAGPTFYFDRVSQIRMPSWSRGRVALVGDAAACPSLLAGQGSALAMVEAYVLAAELARANGDHVEAFARYHERLARASAVQAGRSQGLGLAFAPRTGVQLLVRNTVMRLMGLPKGRGPRDGQSLRDAIELPAVPAA